MSTLITVLIVIAAIVLILIVLVQNSKGGGLSSGFSSSNAIMGVRKTTDFLEKATWGLAGFIIVMSILFVVVTPKSAGGPQSEINTPEALPSGDTPADMSTGFPLPTQGQEQQTPAPSSEPAPAN